MRIRHAEYTRARIASLAEALRGRIYPEPRAPVETAVSPRVERVRFEDAQRLEYRPADLGMQLGPAWSTFWFRVRARVPESWSGARVDLLWISHSEATLWRDGRAVQGLNHQPRAGREDSTRPDAIVLPRARGGETVELFVEVACNQMFGRPSREQTPYD